MSDAGWFGESVRIASGILTLVACLLLIGVIVAGLRAWRAVGEAKTRLVPAVRDLAPLLASLRRTADNLEAVTAAILVDVVEVHRTVLEANHGARAAVHDAERRVRRLGDLVGTVEQEIEGALVGVVAAARGVRAGASVLREMMGVGDADTHPPTRRRQAQAEGASSYTAANRPVAEAETYDSGDFANGDDIGGDPGNNRARPRVRSRRG
jgi:hypothetical protein